MSKEKLSCPRCQTIYPWWRIIFSRRTFRCWSCGAKLTFSQWSWETMRYLGGIILLACFGISKFAWGTEIIKTWQFLVLFLVFALVLIQIMKVIMGVLVLGDELR